MVKLTILLLAAALALVPAVSAQTHDHGAMAAKVAIAHDTPPDGRTYVGDIAHFVVLDLGDDLIPDFHQQNHVRVTLNGAVLFETTPDSGHDYDGVYAFDVVFPATGSYTVEALDDMGMAIGHFSGYVVAPVTGATTLKLDAPTSAMAGVPATFTYRTLGASGAIVPHSDANFEVRQGGTLVFRTKTHTHTEDQSVQYAFPSAGAYTVRVTNFLSFPSGKEAVDFAPSVAEATVMVSPGPPAVGTPSATLPDSKMNDVATGTTSGGTYTLIGTFDPFTIVGPYTQQHLSAIVMDPATRQTVQHVNFKATLLGPLGQTLFHSDTLHEYDGIYALTTMQPEPGVYRLLVDAAMGAWSGHVEMSYTVAPPVEPVVVEVPPEPGVGPVLYAVSGLDSASSGKAMPIAIFGHTLTGQGFPHSEIDTQILDAKGVAVLTTKLHTHSDGKFAITETLPAGDYTLRLSPFTLSPTATPLFYGAKVGDPLDLKFTVGPGAGFPASTLVAQGATSHASPALAPAVLLAGLAALVLAARRRLA